MPQEYGDEVFIHKMARKDLPKQDDENPNDINNGYVVIQGNHIPFHECEIIENRLHGWTIYFRHF